MADEKLVNLRIGIKADTSQNQQTQQQIDGTTKSIDEMYAAVQHLEKGFGALAKAEKKVAEETNKAADATKKHTQQIHQQIMETRQAAQALGEVSGSLAAAGSAIFAPFLLSANKYINAVGRGEESSRRWLDAQERLTKAQVTLGRQATTSLVPYLELLSKIVAQISQIDPRILDVAVKAGGALALAGSIGLLAAQVTKMYSAILQLTSGLMKYQAAQTALGGVSRQSMLTGGVTIGALAVGAGLGVGATRGIGQATGNERLANADFNDALQSAGKLLLSLVAVNLAIAKEIGHVILTIQEQLELIAHDIGDAFGNIIDTLLLSANAITASVANTEILGKRVGDVLGISSGDLATGRRDILTSMDQRAAGSEAGKQSIRDAYDRAHDDLDTAVQDFTDGLLVFADALGIEGIDVPEKGGAASGPISGLDFLSPEQLDRAASDFDQFQKDMIQAEKDLKKQQLKEADKFEEEMEKSEKDFYDGRLKQFKNFDKQQAQQLAEFQRNQSLKLKNFQAKQAQDASDFGRQQIKDRFAFERDQATTIKEAQAAETQRLKDFHRARERAEEDHQDRLRDAVSRLDAASVIRELEGFATEKSRAQEDFSVEGQRIKEEGDQRRAAEREQFERAQSERQAEFQENQARERQQAEESRRQEVEQFNHQRELARENFEAGMKDQEEAFRANQSLRRAEFAQSQRDAYSSFIEQRNERQRAFRQQLLDLIAFNQMEADARQKHYEGLRNQLSGFLYGATGDPASRAASISGFRPSFAEGGYTPEGGIAAHAGEFMMNPGTTQAFERATGGSLSQNRLQQFINQRQIGDVHVANQFGGTLMTPEQLDFHMNRFWMNALKGI